MTPLAALLVRQISQTGPISVAEYMSACLMHPRHGAYAAREPIGAGGDFITAPEISQMFGELVGLTLAQAWLDRGAPRDTVLVELGPGRGTLLADALRAAATVPGFADGVHVWAVEPAPAMRQVQERTLAGRGVRWAPDLGAVPEGPLLLVANEVFDAMPVRQFLFDGDRWRERMVTAPDGALAFALGPPAAFPNGATPPDGPARGDIIEVSLPARALAAEIGGRIRRDGGVAVIVDYGGAPPKGDTLQAVRGHRREGPLDAPGAADITAHVDFGALADAAGCPSAGPVAQGEWLLALGIAARAEALAARLSGTALTSHRAALARLTSPQEMGALFKVLALHDDAGPPAGLGPAGVDD